MKRYFVVYLASLVTIAALDYVWLGHIATAWYESGIGHLMASKPNVWAAAAFYLLYPVGVVLFAAWPSQGDRTRALLLGALFGLFCYGTFDLTSLAILRDWPLAITFIDMAWGACVSAAGAVVGAWALRTLDA